MINGLKINLEDKKFITNAIKAINEKKTLIV